MPKHCARTGDYGGPGDVTVGEFGSYIHYSVADDTARIYLMEVPEAQRGRGVGGKFYQAWESDLPPHVREIHLKPHDGESGRFWHRMGFNFVAAMADGMTMCKRLDPAA